MIDLPVFFADNLTLDRSFGHLTYLLLVLSMLMRDIVWLRIIAIGSAAVEIYYRLYIVPDPIPVIWESIFILVNLGQLAIIAYLNLKSDFSEHEAHFVSIACPTVPPSKARKLIDCGTWHDAEPGDVLIRQGQKVENLLFLTEGLVAIEKDGEVVAHCNRGDFLGEMSFVTGEPATATTRVERKARYLALDQDRLRRLIRDDSDLNSDLQQSFSRNLIGKLSKPAEAAGTV